MIIPLFATAVATAPLDLDLVCPGEYLDEEVTRGFASGLDKDGKLRTANTVIRKPVMRAGTAKVTFTGRAGNLVYPDGRKRELKDVSADERSITASYKTGMGLYTWHVNVNRMTGEIQVKSGSDVGLTATCAAAPPEPTTPKF